MVLIECGFDAEAEQRFAGEILRIDHHDDAGGDLVKHRVEDGQLPATDWSVSSLGQLLRYLGLGATPRQKAIGMMDHNCGAALRGESAEVSARQVLRVKFEQIALAHGVSERTVRRLVQRMRTHIKHAQRLAWSGHTEVADIRHLNLGEGFSLPLLAAQTAAALERPALVHVQDEARGRARPPFREALMGWAPAAHIEHFAKWAAERGLEQCVIQPERGIAMGYLSSAQMTEKFAALEGDRLLTVPAGPTARLVVSSLISRTQGRRLPV